MPSPAGRNAELLLSSGGVKAQGGVSDAVEATVADSPLPRRDPPASRRPRRVNILGVAPILFFKCISGGGSILGFEGNGSVENSRFYFLSAAPHLSQVRAAEPPVPLAIARDG